MKLPRQRRSVPEVIQTSAMDCGPAALKAILEGFGMPVSYGRLREICQTEIDGTSIDTVEEVAVELGLDAEQVMIPADHLLLDEAESLPAVVVVKLPNGVTHFVVVWKRVGPLVQVMDPAAGRQWMTRQSFLRDLYIHQHRVPADAWLEWARSGDFLNPLRARLARLGIRGAGADTIVERARTGARWQEIAALDAAVRLVHALVGSRAVTRGRGAARAVDAFATRAAAEGPSAEGSIPPVYWAVRPVDGGAGELWLRGAILVRFRGRRDQTQAADSAPPAAVRAAMATDPQPARTVWDLVREDGVATAVAAVLGAAVFAATTTILQLVYRGLIDITRSFNLAEQRAAALLVVLLLVAVRLVLASSVMGVTLRLGRRFETRLRLAFLSKLPRLGSLYFASRLVADMAERAHRIAVVRTLPLLVTHVAGTLFGLLVTAAALVWLDPAAAPAVLLVVLVSILVPVAANSVLVERDLRLRTHSGALTRFSLDALLGGMAIRCHDATRSLMQEHQALLVRWAAAGMRLVRASVWVTGATTMVGFAMACALLFGHVGRVGETGMVLLLVYWMLTLPETGERLAALLRVLPRHRNVLLRLLEPLGAPDAAVDEDAPAAHRPAEECPGAEIRLAGVTVRASGHTILEDIHIEINGGEHVAVVGPSGAGKSTLMALLLGLRETEQGTLEVDGRALAGARLALLRRDTVWVDPAVQLWNRSLLDNLDYGRDSDRRATLAQVLETSHLHPVVERLPNGLQTPLGESGALVSGGEGQRVRLARALLRARPRLAILDEALRGLDRPLRHELLSCARDAWSEATLLCVTHDIEVALEFDRVLVMERGRIVEDGRPDDLAAGPNSNLRRLLDAYRQERRMWASHSWRRLTVTDGRLEETAV